MHLGDNGNKLISNLRSACGQRLQRESATRGSSISYIGEMREARGYRDRFFANRILNG